MHDYSVLRLSVFIGTLLLMIGLERWQPRKVRVQNTFQRWLTNLSLLFISAAALRLFGAVTALAAATYAMQQGWGVLAMLPLPYGVDLVLSILLLDLSIYIQHVLSHKVPLFWRFHQVHHSDRDIDATTGVRFHPFEIVVSMFYKCIVMLIIGPAVMAVMVYEIIINASAIFNHSNLRLPLKLDKYLRWVCVTPDMHRVHHSTLYHENNSNYGVFLSVWDRFFRTYIDQPRAGHDNMIIGLDEWQAASPPKLIWCLALPWKKTSDAQKPSLTAQKSSLTESS